MPMMYHGYGILESRVMREGERNTRQRLECVELAPAIRGGVIIAHGNGHGRWKSAGKPGALQTLRAVLPSSLRAYLFGEPGAGVGPVTLGHRLGNGQHLSCFLYRHPDEITELY